MALTSICTYEAGILYRLQDESCCYRQVCPCPVSFFRDEDYIVGKWLTGSVKELTN